LHPFLFIILVISLVEGTFVSSENIVTVIAIAYINSIVCGYRTAHSTTVGR